MAVVNTYGSRIMTGLVSAIYTRAPAGAGGGVVRKWTETIETSAADSATSTYLMARMPSNARIHGASKLAHDALGATTAALGIGIFNPPGVTKITDDPDALNTAIVASTAGTKEFIADRANWGKPLWQFINGQTTDPGCDLDIKVVIEGAVHLSSGAGTITAEIEFSLD